MDIIEEDNLKIDYSEHKENFSLYTIGSEVLLTGIIDDLYVYCIDTIKEIVITHDDITYKFNNVSIEVGSDNIIPYSVSNEDILRAQAYTHTENYKDFNEFVPISFLEEK